MKLPNVIPVICKRITFRRAETNRCSKSYKSKVNEIKDILYEIDKLRRDEEGFIVKGLRRNIFESIFALLCRESNGHSFTDPKVSHLVIDILCHKTVDNNYTIVIKKTEKICGQFSKVKFDDMGVDYTTDHITFTGMLFNKVNNVTKQMDDVIFTTTMNGEEALPVFKKHKEKEIDLVLLDGCRTY